jgi:hypothetical protein
MTGKGVLYTNTHLRRRADEILTKLRTRRYISLEHSYLILSIGLKLDIETKGI